MLSVRRVGGVRRVYWGLLSTHGSGSAWWCRVGSAVECRVQCAVLRCECSWVVLILHLRRASEGNGLGASSVCVPKWGVERGGVAITVAGVSGGGDRGGGGMGTVQ
jgi:hypothetical protein